GHDHLSIRSDAIPGATPECLGLVVLPRTQLTGPYTAFRPGFHAIGCNHPLSVMPRPLPVAAEGHAASQTRGSSLRSSLRHEERWNAPGTNGPGPRAPCGTGAPAARSPGWRNSTDGVRRHRLLEVGAGDLDHPVTRVAEDGPVSTPRGSQSCITAWQLTT